MLAVRTLWGNGKASAPPIKKQATVSRLKTRPRKQSSTIWGARRCISEPPTQTPRTGLGKVWVDEPAKVAFVDQGYTGDAPKEAAAQEGIELLVVKHQQAWICAAASQLGSGTFLRMVGAVSTIGT